MKIFRAFPLFVIPLGVYFLLIAAGLNMTLEAEALVSIPMVSGVTWELNVAHLFIFGSLLVLYVEILRSTYYSRTTMINHYGSVLVFVGCLVLFLTVRPAGNSIFFFLTLLSLLDVLAGFTITARVASRDISIGG